MANPVIINPTLTLAGQAAAFNASNDGLELKITHVSFGTAHYDPDGDELALVAQVGLKVPVAGASRPTPYQIRMVSAWSADVGEVAIGEIAFWSDDTLVFVWSKADGSIASYKTDGVTYVLFNDLAFASVPANSISFVVDPLESVALAALAAHEGAYNAHPQYVLRAKFPDYQGHLWGDVTGTANAITLTLPAIVELTEYNKGNRFSFKATTTNTGDTTINVEGVGAVQVLKTGGVPLSPGSIVAGGVYDVYYDGAKFQLTAGAGFASAEVTDAEAIALTDTTSTSWLSLRRLIKALLSYAKLAGATFTGDVKGLTPAQFDNDTSFATTAFSKRMGVEYSGFAPLTASTALGASSIGGIVVGASATPINITLPPTAGVPEGATVEVVSAGAAAVTVLPAGLDVLASQVAGVISVVLGMGDNAEFVKVSGTWRLRGGSMALKYAAVMSGPNWLTQPQFANDDSFATTKFVQRALGSYSAYRPLAVSTTLTALHVGGIILPTAGGLTFTLPATAGIAAGTAITMYGNSIGATIVPASGVITSNGGGVASIVLGAFDTIQFTLTAASGWYVTGGAAQLIGSSVMAGPNFVTPPQFDNTLKLSTTEFVQRALGSFSGGRDIVGTGITLPLSDVGQFVALTLAGAQTVALPLLSDVPLGATITLHNSTTFDKTITVNGTDKLSPDGMQYTATTLKQGDTISATKEAGVWRLHGVGALKYSAQFAASFGVTGHSKSPNGDIEMWGMTGGAAPNTVMSITFPFAFPNGCRNIQMTYVDGGVQQPASRGGPVQVGNYSNTGFNYSHSGSSSSVQHFWRAKGN